MSKTKANRSISYDPPSNSVRPKTFNSLLFDLSSTPILSHDMNQPGFNFKSNDFNTSAYSSSLFPFGKSVAWAPATPSSPNSRQQSQLRPLSVTHKQSQQQRFSFISNSSSPKKQPSHYAGVPQDSVINFQLKPKPFAGTTTAAATNELRTMSSTISTNQQQPHVRQLNLQGIRNESVNGNSMMVPHNNPPFESILAEPYLLKQYNRKQIIVLRDLRKRFGGKPNPAVTVPVVQSSPRSATGDQQLSPSEVSNTRRESIITTSKQVKEAIINVPPQKLSLSELKMMSQTMRAPSLSGKSSPSKWSPEQIMARQQRNQGRLFSDDQYTQPVNPFIVLQPAGNKDASTIQSSLNRSQRQRHNEILPSIQTEEKHAFESQSITSPSNLNSNRSMTAAIQAPVKTFSKLIAAKKVVKDELDKDQLRKIVEKVEKLLIEKEESNQNDKDDKQSGSNNTSSNTNTIVEKADEAIQTELNFNQHLREIVDVNEHKSQQDSAYASFLKGVGRMKNNKDKSAITAFRQALNFDKTHFATIYNLACLYERNNWLKMAEMWLDVAALFKKNSNDVNYGFAVIYYKSQRYDDAFKKIDGLIIELERIKQEEKRQKEEDRENDSSSDEKDGDDDDGDEDEDEVLLLSQTHQYLRSLCAKKLGQKASERADDKALIKQNQLLESQSRPMSPAKMKKSSRGFQQQQQFMSSGGSDVYHSIQNSSFYDEKKETPLIVQPSSQQYYRKASTDYKAFIQYTCPKNFNLFKHLMFAMVFKKIRKMEIKFPPHIFCEFISLVNQILAAETYTPAFEPIVQSEQLAIDRGIVDPIIVRPPTAGRQPSRQPPLIQQNSGLPLSLLTRRREEILKRIQDLSFFKRFNAYTLAEYLPSLELRYIEKDELLFAKKSEVFIITGGYLTVFDHSKQFNQPDIVAYYSQGDIIGCDDKDNKISFNPDIWFLSITRVEYVAMEEAQFVELWNLQNQHMNRQALSFIRQIDIFDKVSQLTLYRLAFELLEEKVFQNGDIVYNDGESVQKYNYIELHKEDPKTVRNLRNRINNKIEILPLMQQSIQGFYLVQDGSLKLSTITNWQNYTLRKYNFIGENLLFPSLSISRFGQIVSASPSTKCLFLSRYDFHKINSLDKGVMKANVMKSQYYSNCQKILYKYYRYYKIDDFDQPSQIAPVSNSSSNNNMNNNNNSNSSNNNNNNNSINNSS